MKVLLDENIIQKSIPVLENTELEMYSWLIWLMVCIIIFS